MTDALAAELAAIRDRNEATGRRDTADVAVVLGRHAQSAADVPRLLAAVEAALAAHRLTEAVRYCAPCMAHDGPHSIGWRMKCPDCVKVSYTGCAGCRNSDGAPSRPEECATRQAITRALLREEAPGADAR